MSNQSSSPPETASATIEHDPVPEPQLRFGMIVLYARDLERSIAFYRLLGLALPDPAPERPVAALSLGAGVTLIITTDAIARRLDAGWTAPEPGGYRQLIEFFVGDDAAVDALWHKATGAGHAGRTAPGHLIGPYAAVVEDPDGNAVLITSEPADP